MPLGGSIGACCTATPLLPATARTHSQALQKPTVPPRFESGSTSPRAACDQSACTQWRQLACQPHQGAARRRQLPRCRGGLAACRRFESAVPAQPQPASSDPGSSRPLPQTARRSGGRSSMPATAAAAATMLAAAGTSSPPPGARRGWPRNPSTKTRQKGCTMRWVGGGWVPTAACLHGNFPTQPALPASTLHLPVASAPGLARRSSTPPMRTRASAPCRAPAATHRSCCWIGTLTRRSRAGGLGWHAGKPAGHRASPTTVVEAGWLTFALPRGWSLVRSVADSLWLCLMHHTCSCSHPFPLPCLHAGTFGRCLTLTAGRRTAARGATCATCWASTGCAPLPLPADHNTSLPVC